MKVATQYDSMNQTLTPCSVMPRGIIKLKFPNSIRKSLED